MESYLPGFEPPPREDSRDPLTVAHVLVDVDLAHLDHPLDYAVPPELDSAVTVGCTVRVALAGTRQRGWVVGRETVPHHRALSPIQSVVSRTPVLNESTLTLARYIAHKHLATTSQVLSLAIPARHARSEKDVLAAHRDCAVPSPISMDTEFLSWYEGDPTAPGRIVWQVVPHDWIRQLATVVAIRSVRAPVIVVAATREQVDRIAAQIALIVGTDCVETVGSDDSAAHRFAVHLRALAGELTILVGTRSAVWTPVKDLGAIIVWDDGDDRLTEERSPRTSALDVAIARAHLEGVDLLSASLARSVKSHMLVNSSWAVPLTPLRHALREHAPRVRVLDDFDAAREGPSAGNIPTSVQRFIRESAQSGHVLIQVPRRGYVPVIACAQCHRTARCQRCHGPLAMRGDRQIVCQWCQWDASAFTCPHCAAHAVRARQIGSERTAEELARALPGLPLVVSSADHRIDTLRPTDSRIVVATPGAEPTLDGGYEAAVILDADTTAARPELWAYEEAMRRWFGALSRVAPAHPAIVVGLSDPTLGQALVRWDPVRVAADQLAERRSVGFFPFTTIVALDGPAPDVHAIVASLSDAELLGTVPIEQAPTRRAADSAQLSLAMPEHEPDQHIRTLVRTPISHTNTLLAQLTQVRQHRSAHKLAPVRMEVNPPELF